MSIARARYTGLCVVVAVFAASNVLPRAEAFGIGLRAAIKLPIAHEGAQGNGDSVSRSSSHNAGTTLHDFEPQLGGLLKMSDVDKWSVERVYGYTENAAVALPFGFIVRSALPAS